MEAKNRYVGMSVIKKDAKALLAGKPLYTDDIRSEGLSYREASAQSSCACAD